MGRRGLRWLIRLEWMKGELVRIYGRVQLGKGYSKMYDLVGLRSSGTVQAFFFIEYSSERVAQSIKYTELEWSVFSLK